MKASTVNAVITDYPDLAAIMWDSSSNLMRSIDSLLNVGDLFEPAKGVVHVAKDDKKASANSSYGKRGGRAAKMASSGQGFKDLKSTLSKEGRGGDTAGLAAYIAAKAVGRGKLEKMAAAGRSKGK